MTDIWIVFKQEIVLSSKYGFEFEYSKYALHLLTGEQFRGDVLEFQTLNVNIIIGCDLAVLKSWTPIFSWNRSWLLKLMRFRNWLRLLFNCPTNMLLSVSSNNLFHLDGFNIRFVPRLGNISLASSNCTIVCNKSYLNTLLGNLCRRVNDFKLDCHSSGGGLSSDC